MTRRDENDDVEDEDALMTFFLFSFSSFVLLLFYLKAKIPQVSTKRVPQTGILPYLVLCHSRLFSKHCQIEAEEDISREKRETSRVESIELSDRGRIRLEYHFWSFVRIDRDQMSTNIEFKKKKNKTRKESKNTYLSIDTIRIR